MKYDPPQPYLHFSVAEHSERLTNSLNRYQFHHIQPSKYLGQHHHPHRRAPSRFRRVNLDLIIQIQTNKLRTY